MKTYQVGDRIKTNDGEIEVVPSSGNCFSKDSRQCFFLRKKEGHSGLFCHLPMYDGIDAGPCYPTPARCSSICYVQVKK